MHGHVCVIADTKEPCGFLPHSIDTQGRYSYNPRSACKSAAAKFGKIVANTASDPEELRY